MQPLHVIEQVCIKRLRLFYGVADIFYRDREVYVVLFIDAFSSSRPFSNRIFAEAR